MSLIKWKNPPISKMEAKSQQISAKIHLISQLAVRTQGMRASFPYTQSAAELLSL